MSIRYKIFGVFSIVSLLACGLAFYGIRGISNSGDLVVRLYDGPLMGINHARSAHAALNEARLVIRVACVGEGSCEGNGREVRKRWSSGSHRRSQRRARARRTPEGQGRPREGRDAAFKDWSDAVLKILKPPAGGVTELPTSFMVTQKGEDAVGAVDDLVELVAAYGYDYRTEAEAAAAASRTTMLSIAIGTAIIGLMIAARLRLLTSAGRSSPPCRSPSGWPPVISTDKIDRQAAVTSLAVS